MIIITNRYDRLLETSFTKNVWEVDIEEEEGVEESYKKFMLVKAEADHNLVVNPHWLNAMNYQDHNTHLFPEDYKLKCKEWKKTLKYWTIDRHIKENLGGIKKNFETINKF